MISDEKLQELLNTLCVNETEGFDLGILCSSVASIKLRDASVVPPSARTVDVIKLLQTSQRGAVVIMTSEIVGIFTERDLVKKFFDLKLDDPIKKHMTSPVKTVSPTDPLVYALTLMSQGGFRHLPVLQDNVLLGVISVRDILDFISQKILGLVT
ncbi:MAG: CBS domain-containing protein [Deltaproteobacteria bacterium]|nr:CBS domain-containing protein [Deltaproteobacteria bacterium]MCX7952744.1 CBS domain-containing protein [Deltaproteobacteria bacterium]